MLRRLITTIALSLCLLAPALAQDAEKVALIKKLFGLMNIKGLSESIMAASFGNMHEQILQNIGQKLGRDVELSEEKQKALQGVLQEYAKQVATRFQTRFQEQINLVELTEQISLPIYDKNFSVAELKDLIAFYETPTGQKMINVMPQMTQESMQKTTEAILPQIMQIASEDAEEEKELLAKLLKDAGIFEPPPPPPPAPKARPTKRKR